MRSPCSLTFLAALLLALFLAPSSAATLRGADAGTLEAAPLPGDAAAEAADAAAFPRFLGAADPATNSTPPAGAPPSNEHAQATAVRCWAGERAARAW
jgi:hypothetical protein